MKFGFGRIPHQDLRDHIRIVQLAEGLGFEFAFLSDQTFNPDPYVYLGAIAEQTSHIHLGVGVTNPFTRHPCMTARAIATVEMMAPGRISLGIGAANRKELINPLGLNASDTPGKIREMIEILRLLLAGSKVSYQGRYFKADGIQMGFESRADLPIYVAARGPRVLQIAGELADGVLIGGLCQQQGISYALDHLAQGAKKAGRNLAELEIIAWVFTIITDNRETDIRYVKKSAAHIIGGAPLSMCEAVGLPMDHVLELKQIYSTQGIPQAASAIGDELVDAVTLVGSKDEIVERIQMMRDSGYTVYAGHLAMVPGTAETPHDRIRRFAEAIFPEFV